MRKVHTEKLLRVYIVVSTLIMVLIIGGLVYTNISLHKVNQGVTEANSTASDAVNAANQASDSASEATTAANDANDAIDTLSNKVDDVCLAISGC